MMQCALSPTHPLEHHVPGGGDAHAGIASVERGASIAEVRALARLLPCV